MHQREHPQATKVTEILPGTYVKCHLSLASTGREDKNTATRPEVYQENDKTEEKYRDRKFYGNLPWYLLCAGV